MRALIHKEVRENARLVAIGLLVAVVLLGLTYRMYAAAMRAALAGNVGFQEFEMLQPLLSQVFVLGATWFCAVFGGFLGWMQIHNERPRDLWSFLVHRPISPTGIFLSKVTAGLGIYFGVTGLPLVIFVIWLRYLGGLVAPFEWAMVLPVGASVLGGVVYYFAAMLTAVRQARWYASRGLPLLAALVVSGAVTDVDSFWQALLIILAVTGALATAVWGSFHTQGDDAAQPLAGKLGLTASLTIGTSVAVAVGVGFLLLLVLSSNRYQSSSSYTVRKDGTIFKSVRRDAGPIEFQGLEGKPVLDPVTGEKMAVSDFNRNLSPHLTLVPNFHPGPQYMTRLQQRSHFYIPWRTTSDTAWYFWRRYGRLVAFDLSARRLSGSLGPDGFAPGSPAGRTRFRDPTGYNLSARIRTMSSDKAVYQVDLERRTSLLFFESSPGDPVGASEDLLRNGQNWEYTAVVTRSFVHLVSSEGKLVGKIPYQPSYADSPVLQVYSLEMPGEFMFWEIPPGPANARADWKLPIRVTRVSGKAPVKTAELPTLAGTNLRLDWKIKAANIFRPAISPLPVESPREAIMDWKGLLVCLATAVLVYVPLAWWLGTRYAFSLKARVWWSLLVLATGFPGLLAFLSVNTFPAREPCPRCGKLRVVSRKNCEHCDAEFGAPERRGTEIFEPAGAV